ncbi:amidase family protein [Guptibacillus algicola]|uniref:amidase family protein n=1 Tax=Guptibacillus algicola TaxID=225844 RepID=UPI001CD6ECBC|nr:amidase family protein [Alkalihalobacillus algicola]MCA0989043.1 amidase [Alkalihalobacillus algicola]
MVTIEWLEKSTILDLQQAMFEGTLTSHELVCFYLEQISNYNSEINAVLEVNQDALFIAEGLDRERSLQGPRGPLHGIPILLKDNINTGDSMHTSAGSSMLANSFGNDDAFIVSNLRKAGAVILGKTNMTEWANFMSDTMPNGYSSRGGQVLNPYGPRTLDVGGSSSGSAAAVACHFATASIGTETNGSILNPSSSNCAVGIKPTVGLVSRQGIIPISSSQDTAGPITRNITDAAILLGILSGQDNKDPSTLAAPVQSDYTPYLFKPTYENIKLGVIKNGYYEEMHPEEQEQFDFAVTELKNAGCSIIEVNEITPDQEALENDYNVLLYEFKAGIEAYLANETRFKTNLTLTSIVEYNEKNEEDALKYGQSLLLEANKTSGTLTEPEYLKSRLNDITSAKKNGLDSLFKNEGLDAILFGGSYGSTLPAKAGYPSITVPAGFTSNGKPFGLTFTGTPYSEPQLIKLGYTFERLTDQRRLPKVITKTVTK